MQTEVPSTPSILIIDDNDVMAELIAVHLSLAGYKNVRVAEDAVVGGRKMLDSPPDLIISDIMMPFLDGLELLEAMRGDERTKNMSVILLSAQHDDATFERAKRLGACAFLQKPVNSDELLATIRRVLIDPKPM